MIVNLPEGEENAVDTLQSLCDKGYRPKLLSKRGIFVKMLKSMFKTKDIARLRRHKDDENLWQMIYQILGAYFEDDCADELTNDPVLTAILDKKALTSQPTLSRFFNRMDESTLEQFYALMRRFRKVVYTFCCGACVSIYRFLSQGEGGY